MFSLLFPYAAALIKSERTKTLLIADLHIGWEVALQEKGIHIPSQTDKILIKLKNIISEFKPDRLVILGDVKFTFARAEFAEWQDVPDFFSYLLRFIDDISVVRGNHDGNIERLMPEKVKLLPASGAIVDGVGIFHGHKWPSSNLLKCKTLVMGHLHPSVVFRDSAGFKITRQVWLRADCNGAMLARAIIERQNGKSKGAVEDKIGRLKPQSQELFVMPSFNDLLGGKPVNEAVSNGELGNEALIGPVLRSKAVDVANSEIYLLDGTYLGKLSQLKAQF
jgi:uncharacterized protein